MGHGRLRPSFTGYYGMSNFGDDLFGMVCSAAARKYWNADPRLVGPAIAGVEAHYTMPHGFPAALYGGPGWVGKACRYYSFLRATRGCDVLVLGGGSVIGSRESFRKPMMISAHGRGVQLAAVGVSIGPFDDAASEASAAEFISRFSYISVRDRRSYELAVRMGLGGQTHSGRDLAGLLPLLAPGGAAPFPDQAGSGPVRIGIAPCNYGKRESYPTPDRHRLQRAMVAALAGLASDRPLQVEIFSLNDHDRHGDYALSLELHDALRNRGVAVRLQRYRNRSPADFASAIGNCDAFVSARLHGAIVAYLQGVPAAIIDYHPKCNDFADEIGLPAAQRITARRHDEAAVLAALTAMLDGRGAPALPREVYARQAEDIFKRAPWFAGEETSVDAGRVRPGIRRVSDAERVAG